MTQKTKLTIKKQHLPIINEGIQIKNWCKGSQMGYRTIVENSRILHIYKDKWSICKTRRTFFPPQV